MDEFRAEDARPNPKSTINSYRSFGYNLSTAIADIIDNSISARASKIELEYEWNGRNSYISFFDNGVGMNLEELILAMTPGSKDPEDERDENDLGRFGMGLKTASFSQCKRLTVVSKKKGYKEIKRCWDIDYINKTEEWVLLDFISDDRYMKRFNDFDSGTLVLWENLDRLVGDSDYKNERVKDAFYSEMMKVQLHLSLVFHRFIENSKITIELNSNIVEPWNPFLYKLSTKPEMGITERIDNSVEITYYILPHMSRISDDEYNESGGPLGWFNQQGFYVYRGDRLLVSGDWLGLEKKREYSKLARIAINFPNASDFDWNLDIKKSTASPPIEIRKELRRITKIAIKKSAKVYNWRGQKTLAITDKNKGGETLWYDSTTRDGVKKYKINRKHPLIKQSLLTDSNQKIISKSLKIIEDNIPLELILYNQNEDPSLHELEKISETPSDELISLAIELFNINVSNGLTESLARDQILSSTPFNLFPLIENYLK